MRVGHGRAWANSDLARGSLNKAKKRLCYGMVHFQVLNGNGNRPAFLHFLDDLAHHRDLRGIPGNTILVMDNVQFHHGAEVEEMMGI